jgi:cytochrome c2
MKKIVKILGIIVGCVVLAAVGFCTYVALTGIPSYDPPATLHLTVQKTPARIKRGEAIAHILCIQCHAAHDNRLTGKAMHELPELFGTLYSPNITQDKKAGIGNWTDGDLKYYLRTGVRPDGTFAPIMPKFPLMADDDVESIIAWLRSDQFAVQASPQEAPVSEYSFVTKFLAHTMMGAKPYEPTFQTIPDSTDEVTFGRYMANGLADCYSCHSADFTKQSREHPEQSAGFYGGGNEMKGEGGKTIFSANLTFDEQTGIGKKYTKAQFIKAVKGAVRPDGSILRAPMGPHPTLTDYEVGAIYEYLKTIPKIHNDVAKKNAEAQLAAK